MKIFHTGDWHIGKVVNNFNMLEEQKYVLNQLFDAIEKEKPDCLIIAGDIYDRAIPSVEAVNFLDKTLNNIIFNLKIPVLAIAGNHDSNERIGFGNKFYEASNFFVSGELKKDVKKVILKDEGENVNFYLIPYADPYYVRQLFNDSTIKTHEDAIKKIVEKIDLNKDERNVVVFHGYVCKGTEKIIESDSEKRLSIGGADIINSKVFKDFDYVALGHIHRNQSVDKDRIRYAGSLMKYSFSEIKNKIGVTSITLNKDRSIEYENIPFSLLRDFKEIKGELDELICKEYYDNEKLDDYIRVVLTNEREVLEPMQRLRAIYPNIMELKMENGLQELALDRINSDKKKEKTTLELTCDFFKEIGGREISDDELSLVKDVLDKILKENK